MDPSRTTLALACTVLMASTSLALADRRAYGVTYEAVTAPQGELDVETWSTFSPQGEVDGGPSSRGMREMVEIEYGITDHWDVAVYNMLDVITSGETKSGYAGLKLETRYRPSDRGEWPIDPVFYVEFQELFRGDARQKYEAKLILAKDFGDVNIAANVALEEERTTDPAWNTEIEYAFGTSYAFSPAWIVGAEIFGKAEKDEGNLSSRNWVGPALSWAGGGRGSLRGSWVTLAGGAGLGGEADPYYARLIVGLQFR